MNFIWTNEAREGLYKLQEYISKDDPQAAQRLLKCIIQRSKQISTFPYSGRQVPEFKQTNIREVLEFPYRIIYRITHRNIEVATVFHCSRIS